MKSTGWTGVWLMLVVGVLCLFTLRTSAQVQTKTTETVGQSTQEVQVEHAEIVSVYGNDLILRMEDGSIRHIANVPDSARALVDGKEISIHDAKPGMKLQRTITTTTTPKTITTVKSVTGKVWHVNPPTSVILALEDGTNQSFNIPKGQQFNVDGQMVDAWGLKKGMKISATKIVEEPITVVDQQKQLTGRMPPPPPPPPADVPILVAAATPPPAAAPAAPAELPKTGSLLPWIGLLGSLSLLGSLGLRAIRLL
jgi:hypothetical protein